MAEEDVAKASQLFRSARASKPNRRRRILKKPLSKSKLLVKRPAAHTANSQSAKQEEKARIAGEMRKFMKSRGKTLLLEMWAVVRQAILPTAPCVTHGQHCPVHPSLKERAGRRYLIIGGNVCVPWSTLGNAKGWIHSCTVAFVIWLADMMRASPEIIIDECTQAFDFESMAELLSPTHVCHSIGDQNIQGKPE